MKTLKQNNRANYIALGLISIPLGLLVLFITFGMMFFGSIYGVIVGSGVLFGVSYFVYRHIPTFRLPRFSIIVGMPLFLFVGLWAWALLPENSVVSIVLLIIGGLLSFGIPELSKDLANKRMRYNKRPVPKQVSSITSNLYTTTY